MYKNSISGQYCEPIKAVSTLQLKYPFAWYLIIEMTQSLGFPYYPTGACPLVNS